MGICLDCVYSVAIEGDEDGLLECHRHSVCAFGLDESGSAVSGSPACEPTMWYGDWERTNRLGYDADYSMWEA